ncbi:hypothetical protein GRP89_08480 [Citrobacter freundii]|nr:hypothetical protein GRP89_08480 [Citrobacter freundii]HCB1505775.1 hypothetical protein [Citrobacter freundii]HCB1516958.1 hypothetical protein [Citrobacter freundii]
MNTPDPSKYFNVPLDDAMARYFETSYQPDGKAPDPEDYFQVEQPAETPPAPDEQLNPVYGNDTPAANDYFDKPDDEYQAVRNENIERMEQQQKHMREIIKLVMSNN